MTARARILAETLRTSGAITGPTRAVHPVLRALSVPWQYDGRRSRYLVPVDRFNGVLDALAKAGHRIDVIGGGLW